MKTMMASVGTVQLFDPSTKALISTSKTLTESAINMASTAEEARGGQGNMLLGKYYHNTSFGLTLTDQLFDLNYLALNCGGAIEAGSDVIKTEQCTVASGKVTVTDTPVAFPTTSDIVGWYKLSTAGEDAWQKIDFTGKEATVSEANGAVVCVKYFYNSASARKFTVSATFVPSIVHAVMTVPLFKAGTEASAMTSSAQVGQLVIDVPNFQLNGAQDLSLTSSGIASTALGGSALATFDGSEGCDGHGYYAVITEEIFNKNWYDNVTALVIDDTDVDLTVGESQTLNVYAMYSDGTNASKIDPSYLTFTADGTSATVSSAGVVTADATITGQTIIEVVATNKTSLVAKAVVTVVEA